MNAVLARSYYGRERRAKEKSGNLANRLNQAVWAFWGWPGVLVNPDVIVLTRGEPRLLRVGLRVSTCHELLPGFELARDGVSGRSSRIASNRSRRSSRCAASPAATPAATTTSNTTKSATDDHLVLTPSNAHNILGNAAFGVSPHTVQIVVGAVRVARKRTLCRWAVLSSSYCARESS